MTVAAGNFLLKTDHDPYFVPVGGGFFLHQDLLRPDKLARADARHHPRNISYTIPAAYRAAIHALAHPDATLTGFGALALFGLPVLADPHDTVMLHPSRPRKQIATRHQPTIMRTELRPGETWQVSCAGSLIQVACPAVATVHALRAIQKGEVRWAVETISDDPRLVRAVQLIDATSRYLSLPHTAITQAASRRLDSRWLAKGLSLSTGRADSPKETEMRLILRGVATRFGFTLVDQVPVQVDGKTITTADAALMEPAYAYMYDGDHHWKPAQRAKDVAIGNQVQFTTIRMLRFVNGTLPHIPAVTERLLRQDKWL